MSISTTSKKALNKIERITGSKLTLGRLIWAIRKSDDMSQVDFARKLGISKQHLCDIEQAKRPISPKLAAHYAKILGYPPEQFIRLCIQDIVDREGLNVIVEIISKRKKKLNDDHDYAYA